MYCKYWYVLTSIGMYRKNYVHVLYVVVCIDIFASGLISFHNTHQILAQYIPMHTTIHAHTFKWGKNQYH